MADPIKVAIIGGGCAAVTAAFELTKPHLQGRYEVTLYQLGFRLGGKGASGRGAHGRIEEHGLHLWMGFYENAFRLMRECYQEAARDPATCPIATWQDAFHPDPYCGVMDWAPRGEWLPWVVRFPALPGLPGDGGAPRLSMLDYATRTAQLLRTMIAAIAARVEGRPAPQSVFASVDGGPGGTWTDPSGVAQDMGRLLGVGHLIGVRGMLEGLALLEAGLSALPTLGETFLKPYVDMVDRSLRAHLEAITDVDDELRRMFEVVDLCLAALRGALRFRLFTDPRGFDVIDRYDCREWLKLNGATDRALGSAFVRGLYDLAFGYEDGNLDKPRIAAGQALRGAVRAFYTYRGAFFWKMQAGMGDVVFAPFQEVLEKRGVRFEYFHRLENVGLVEEAQLQPGETPYVARLEFDVQAKVAGGGPYRPLVNYQGLPCWPSEADWSQLEEGERLRDGGVKFESWWDRSYVEKKTLNVGEDFDLVVLGVGVGAVEHVCQELIAREPKWAAMAAAIKSVPTQAMQIWLDKPMRELGWQDEPVNISGYVEPFDTWADMTHLNQTEELQPRPQAIAYFCSCLPDHPSGSDRALTDYPLQRREEVKQNALRFLDEDIQVLWPDARGESGGFCWEHLSSAGTGAAPDRSSAARLDDQYWTANVNPTDRYALSLPGTLEHRLSPLDESFDNLTICGDWTDCGFNEGCVEAAVMSGLLAAHAISTSPALEEIVGYDHP